MYSDIQKKSSDTLRRPFRDGRRCFTLRDQGEEHLHSSVILRLYICCHHHCRCIAREMLNREDYAQEEVWSGLNIDCEMHAVKRVARAVAFQQNRQLQNFNISKTRIYGKASAKESKVDDLTMTPIVGNSLDGGKRDPMLGRAMKGGGQQQPQRHRERPHNDCRVRLQELYQLCYRPCPEGSSHLVLSPSIPLCFAILQHWRPPKS